MNTHLNRAKQVKNDEFYTRFEDIEKELQNYKDHFQDKVIYCNCDNPEYSNFWKYFAMNFNRFGLRSLIASHLAQGTDRTFILEMQKSDGVINLTVQTCKGDGDFRSKESIDLLKRSDLVVTNPPFSLFRDFIDQLNYYKKEYLIIGSLQAIIYRQLFSALQEGVVKIGFNSPSKFMQPSGHIPKEVSTRWYTNLPIIKENKPMDLQNIYNSEDYPKYDNYDAIEVSKVKNIPRDYKGSMGVPITYLDKHNPDIFSIEGLHIPILNGKKKFARIFIKRKEEQKMPTPYVGNYPVHFIARNDNGDVIIDKICCNDDEFIALWEEYKTIESINS